MGPPCGQSRVIGAPLTRASPGCLRWRYPDGLLVGVKGSRVNQVADLPLNQAPARQTLPAHADRWHHRHDHQQRARVGSDTPTAADD
jgi:hypothetical protein